jgi:putative CocE/NonD family hydrolase
MKQQHTSWDYSPMNLVRPMMRSRQIAALLILGATVMLLLMTACGTPGSETGPDSEEVASSAPFAFPEPHYDVRLDASVMVAMRDGVHLATDLYFPIGAHEPLPVILTRTPYDKNTYRTESSEMRMFAGQGFVVAVQDVRGKFESWGEYTVSAADREDGYDTISWLVEQPWSNGRVGTYGCSYLGENQMMLAAMRHPNHAAMIPQAAGGAVGSAGGFYSYFGLFDNGVPALAGFLGWFRSYGSKEQPPSTASGEPGPVEREPVELPEVKDWQAVWRSLPTADQLKVAGGPPTDYEECMTRSLTDPWWDSLGYLRDEDRYDVPALHVNSWYDFGAAQTLFLFRALQDNAETERGRDNQFMVMSPSTHCGSELLPANAIVGELPVGDPRLDYWSLYIDWFDHWLRDVDNGVTDGPRVRYYVTGANEWRTAPDWPAPGLRTAEYFLHSNGGARGRQGDGWLSSEPPGEEPGDTFIYNPENPVPTVGGSDCCWGTEDEKPGALDQSTLELRDDLLVYTSAELESPVEVIGAAELALYLSTDVPDTDIVAKLIDVFPDGRAFNIQEMILRARYRKGVDWPALLQPGEVHLLRIRLSPSAHVFLPGHRIRLDITGSNFPRYERNLNTGGNSSTDTEWQVATITVHHSDGQASLLLLPVMGEGK